MTTSRARSVGGALLAATLAVVGFFAWTWRLVDSLRTDTIVLRSEAVENDFARAAQADWNLILANDQTLSLWGAVENAWSITTGDLPRLVRQGQCWPMPASATLGEHMIELGVLASPTWLATRDPVATYNLALLAALVVAATGMYLFLFRHTSSMSGSLVGALAFAFATPRLVDLPIHPAVVGTHWIPWVLWSFERSLSREGALPLVVFGVTLLLSGLVGSYPLLSIAVVGAAYGSASLWQRRRTNELETPALVTTLAVAMPAVAIVGALLAIYAHVHGEWMLQPNAGGKFVVTWRDYLPGGLMSVGSVSLAGLVMLALMRGAGARAVPGLVLSAGAGLVVATAVSVGEGETWSVFEMLARRIALLDSVRAPGKVGLAVCFAVQALGAIGWSRAFAEIGRIGRAFVVAVLLVVIGIEVAPPEALKSALGSGAAVELRPVALPIERVEKFQVALAGNPRPVLDLPLGRMVKAPLQLLDAAYHGHETSACYNSLVPPTLRAAYALVSHGHGERAIAEIAAAGFGYVIERQVSPTRPLQSDSFPAPARLLAFEEEFAIWQMPEPGPVHHDVAKLAFQARGGGIRGAFFAPDPPYELDIEVTNNGDVMWAAPNPASPLVGEIELGWKTTKIRGVLPLALEAHQSTVIQLVLFDEPPPGSSGATVTLEGIGKIAVSPDFAWADH